MDDLRETLVSDDAFARAARTALHRAQASDGTVTWRDVSGDVPAEQWGRLVESDLLVATDAGFVVDDPDAVAAILDDRGPASEMDDAGATADGWATADKFAGVAALSLMASYQVPGARDAVGSTVHLLLGPVEAALPFGLTIALLAVATTLVSTTVRSRLVDGSPREELTERMETVREQLDAARERGNDAAVDRLRSRRQELAREQLGALKAMLRPMAWTMLVTVPVFLWLTWLTVNPAAAITPAVQVAPLAGRVVWTARLVGPMRVWMGWYFLCSVASSVAGKRAVRRVRPVVAS